MMAELKGKASTVAHFARFNAFIDRGWLATLRPLQKDVWMIYLSHADEEGLAFPSPASIASKLRHAKRQHVLAARKQLVAHGLMEMVTPAIVAGPNSKAAVYRVLTPPATQITSPESGLVRNQNQSRNGSKTSPVSGHKPVPNRDIQHPIEQLIQHPNRAANAAGTIFASKPDALDRALAGMPPIPVELAGEDFDRTWSEFLEYRRQAKQKLTPIGARRLLQKITPWGKASAIHALVASMENGWRGVFEPKAKANGDRYRGVGNGLASAAEVTDAY